MTVSVDRPVQYSCELFPPKTTAAQEQLRATVEKLQTVGPSFFSVTFGAGGSTQTGTAETVLAIAAQGISVAPHISCIGQTRNEIRALLALYVKRGIQRIVALRGDMPSGTRDYGEFRFASDLVSFIRSETGSHFHIEVAAYPEMHPEAPNPTADLGNFATKVAAGADSAITQYFYNADAYFRFVDAGRRRGLDLPIVPGIMPITNYTQLARFSSACGAEIPRWLQLRLQEFGDDLASLRDFGIDVTTALCARLLAGGAPGLHFYTLNRADATLAIWRNLGLPGKV